MRLPRLALDQGGNVETVAVTPNGKAIFAAGYSVRDWPHHQWGKPAYVFVWKTDSGRLLHQLPGFYQSSNAVTASPDSRRVLASGATIPVALNHSSVSIKPDSIISWDWKTGQKISVFPGFMPLSISPDGKWIGDTNGIHEATTGRLIFKVPKGIPSDGQCAFSPDGKLFGFIGTPTLNKKGFMDAENGGKLYYSTTRLHLWRTDTGQDVRAFPFTRVRAFDFSHDGQWLILLSEADGMTGGTDGSVLRRVNLQTGVVAWTRERRYNDPGHDMDAVFNSVAISPSGKYIIAQSGSCQLVVFEAATGKELFRPFSQQDSGEPSWALPGGLAFSTDGRTLVSRCGHKMLVWDASSLQ